MKHPFLKTVCLFLLPALLLSGCWQEELVEEESPVHPDQVLLMESEAPEVLLPEQFSLPYAPELTLDPITCADGMQQVVSSLLYEGLFRLGPDFQPQPWLCENYGCEGTKYTFTLRSGITFSDGSPLTAKDVKATLDRARSSQRYGGRLSAVTRISAKNETVTITLSSPNSGFPALLDIPIVKSGTERGIPVGTGPYLFSAENSGDCLIANQSWWQGGTQPVDRIALVEASDQNTMLYRFTSHDVQLVTADLTGSDPITTTGSFVFLDVNTTILQYIGCNVTREPLDSAVLRRALWSGIDREQLVSSLLSGHGTAAQFPVSPASPLYLDDLEEAYSTVSAGTLAAGGITIEQPLILLVNEENRFKVSMARQIAANFTTGGIPVDINVLPWEDYTAALAAGNFDLYYGEVKLTADWDLSSLLGTNGSLNYGGWQDPQTDQLLADFAADHGAAGPLYDHLRRQAPILPVCFKSTSTLVQSGVLDGLISTAAEPFYNLTDCTVHLQPASS